ncbi:MAG: DUF1552 domain-containing protein [Chthoniobacter sp.]|uniref:DUF1552 domain-containing protein n=1 Tax=Chthoniobacter sp. TaxID=2510640 RepID=UPI0032A6FDCF
MKTPLLSRRTLLRGLGTAVALPWLEAMGQLTAYAAGPDRRTAPNRLAFLYVPNGKDMPNWTPRGDGPLADLPSILAPLAPVKNDLLVLTGLAADKARAYGDGGGDHARAMAAFLTGVHPRKTDGADLRAGTSVDQLAAQRIGALTRLPSLEIGGESGSMAGNCDSGYSCVYSSTVSWKSSTQPLPKEINPKLVFERLFGQPGGPERARRDLARKSVLDFIRDDSRQLVAKMGEGDRQKLDEYFTSIREIELRMQRAASLPAINAPPGVTSPKGMPDNYAEHLRLLCDMLVLAFQADVTRVCTFVFANESSNKSYPELGVNEGHHELSHHGHDAEKIRKVRAINTFHVTQLAYLLKRLKSIREGDGTLLDHCMIAYGCGNSDGDRHNHDDLPILLAGRGGGTIATGRHMRFKGETPVSNLWTSLLERMDVRVPFGDSTGPLSGLTSA